MDWSKSKAETEKPFLETFAIKQARQEGDLLTDVAVDMVSSDWILDIF